MAEKFFRDFSRENNFETIFEPIRCHVRSPLFDGTIITGMYHYIHCEEFLLFLSFEDWAQELCQLVSTKHFLVI